MSKTSSPAPDLRRQLRFRPAGRELNSAPLAKTYRKLFASRLTSSVTQNRLPAPNIGTPGLQARHESTPFQADWQPARRYPKFRERCAVDDPNRDTRAYACCASDRPTLLPRRGHRSPWPEASSERSRLGELPGRANRGG